MGSLVSFLTDIPMAIRDSLREGVAFLREEELLLGEVEVGLANVN